MPLIVDVTSNCAVTRGVARSWVTHELLSEQLWVWPDEEPEASDPGFAHEFLTNSSQPPPIGLNASINRLRRKADIELVCLVPTRCGDWRALIDRFTRFREFMTENFAADADTPVVLVVVPTEDDDLSSEVGASVQRNDERSPVQGGALTDTWMNTEVLRALSPVQNAYFVHPESSPSPELGNELLGSPVRAVLHVLTLLTRCWAGGSASAPLQPISQRTLNQNEVRLVRGWSRVADVGHVEDHVARALADVRLDTRRSLAARRDSALEHLLRGESIADDLAMPPTPAVPEPLVGWAYIVAFTKFALVRVLGVLFSTITDRLLEPVLRFVRKAIAGIARMLGARRSVSDGGELRRDSSLERAWTESETSIEALDQMHEVGDQPAAGAFWNEFLKRLLSSIDDGSLSVVEAIGPAPDDDTLVGDFLGHLQALDHTSRGALESLREPTAAHMAGDDLDNHQGSRWWRWIGRASFLMVVIVAVVFFGPFGLLAAPIAALLMLGGGVVFVVSILQETLRRLIVGFRAETEPAQSEEELIRRIGQLTDHIVRLGYRSSQLAVWIGVLRSVLGHVADSTRDVAVFEDGFLPSGLPPSLQVATGVFERRAIETFAEEVRRSPGGSTLYSTAWELAVGDFPMAPNVRTRRGTGEQLSSFAEATQLGLPESIREHARSLVRAQLEPDRLMKAIPTVARWQPVADRFGGVSYEPPAGVASLGPAGTQPPVGGSVALDEAVAVGEALTTTGSDGSIVVRLDTTGSRLIRSAETGEPADLAVTDGELGPGERLVIGGLGQISLGRSVVAAVNDGAQGVAFAPATIGRLDGGGDFTLDRAAQHGTPVVDVESGRVLGIVVRGREGGVAGPLAVRRAIDVSDIERFSGTADPGRAAVGELDVGIEIPRDVAVSLPDFGSNVEVGVPAGAADGAVLESLESFLAAITTEGDSAFNRMRKTPEGVIHEIDEVEHLEVAFWVAPSGRSFVTAHRVELGGRVSFEDLWGDRPNPGSSTEHLESRTLTDGRDGL